MTPNKNWIDEHFASKRQAPPPPKPSRWILKLFVTCAFLAVLAFGGVVALDYTGAYPSGLAAKIGIPAREQSPPSPRSQVKNHQDTPAAPLFGRANERAAQRVEDPEPTNEEETLAASTAGRSDAAAGADTARKAQERAASLNRGMDLMKRELAKVAEAEAPHQWQLSMRIDPHPPYSAAERVRLANQYLSSNRKWTAQEIYEIKDERTRSQAQVTNATRRLKELSQNRQSLQARINKAEADIAALGTP